MSYHSNGCDKSQSRNGPSPRFDKSVFAAVPEVLKSKNRWVSWRYECRTDKDGKPAKKPTKVPISPSLGGGEERLNRASSVNPSTWGSFDQAIDFANQHDLDGIGVMLGDGLSGTDLDGCIRDSVAEPWAQEIIKELDTYTEVSPSGTGYKMLLFGKKNQERCRTGGLEIYGEARFFTVTGRHVEGTPNTVNYREVELDKLLARYFPVEVKAQPSPDGKHWDGQPATLEDERIIQLASSAANGDKFRKLFYNGDSSAHADDHSSADAALCSMLVFYTRDQAQVERLFSRSALNRDKWDRRPDYRERTIQFALDHTTETYRGDKDEALRRLEVAAEAVVRPADFEVRPRGGADEFTREAVKRTAAAADEKAALAYRFNPIPSAEFASRRYTQEWLIKMLLVRGGPCIVGGPKKAMKTSLLVDLAISLGSGTPFLGAFQVPKPVSAAIVSGESGEPTLQETFFRISKAKGVRPEHAGVWWDFRLPQLAQKEELAELALGLAKRKIEVVIIDPLYLCLLSGQDASGKQASNLFDMGPLLLSVARACLDAGATPLLAAHARKNLIAGYDPIELEDLAFSGIQEFTRQWMLLNRRTPYNPGSGLHQLWFSVGGSVGHGGTWGINLDEGKLNEDFGGREWSIQVEHQGVVIQQAKEEKAQQKLKDKQQNVEELCAEFLKTLDAYVLAYQEQPSRTKLKTTLGWREEKFSRVLSHLVFAKRVEMHETKHVVGQGAKRKGEVIRRTPGMSGAGEHE
jgi:replicative DNA helicase